MTDKTPHIKKVSQHLYVQLVTEFLAFHYFWEHKDRTELLKHKS
jgi:hypothetical protein